MTNILAIFLVLTTLLATEIWSPNPGLAKDQKEDVIVKEGHRVVVVETFNEDGRHNTKVSISPEKKQEEEEAAPILCEDPLPGSKQQRSDCERRAPGELVCDALGKCTYRIARAIGKAKDRVSGVAHEARDKVCEGAHEAVAGTKEAAQEVIDKNKEIAHEAKHKAEDGYQKAKEAASQRAHEEKETTRGVYEKAEESASQKAQEVKGSATETAARKAHEATEAAKDVYGKAKESASQKAREVKGIATESLEKARGAVKTAKDMGKTIGEDVARTVPEQMDNVREVVVEKAKKVGESTAQAGNRTLHQIVRYMTSPSALSSLMGVANLMGFATAYGMCIWVTFISSHILAGVLPRQQFGIVQSKIYPVYFRAMAYSIIMALSAHLVGRRNTMLSVTPQILQAFNLLASIIMVIFNGIYLEPLATKGMYERIKMKKEEGRRRGGERAEQQQKTDGEPSSTGTETSGKAAEDRDEEETRLNISRLNARIKKLNSYSSFLNILSLMALTWHLVYLGQPLHCSRRCV